jgi:3',5'-cyclic AMP phosphodiesterase CpdA
MPVYLPPISRRRFLSRSLAAATGLAFGRTSVQGAAGGNNRCWALLSDTHLAADRSLIFRGVNPTKHFKQVSQELLQLPTVPAGVLVTGDCAYNSGELGDYSLLGELLNPVREAGMPIHLALGNHDHRAHFWEALKSESKTSRPVADKQTAIVCAEGFNWIILDSLETTLSTPGLLGPEQLRWLAKVLDENPKTPALVVVHHNPGLNGGNLGLKDTFPLFEVIRPRQQVKAYIFGHTHNWNVGRDTSGIHLINLPPVSYVFTEGLPSGWVRAMIEDKGMELELRCIDRARKDHGQKVKLEWRA